ARPPSRSRSPIRAWTGRAITSCTRASCSSPVSGRVRSAPSTSTSAPAPRAMCITSPRRRRRRRSCRCAEAGAGRGSRVAGLSRSELSGVVAGGTGWVAELPAGAGGLSGPARMLWRMSDEYDLIVLGGGPGGENVADRAVQGGLTAVIVESELVGGECSYWACTPSKALLRPGHALRAAQSVAGVTGGRLDPAAVLARRDSFTAHWSDDGQVDWLRSAGIDLVRGHGRLSGEREVTVETGDGDRVLRARHAVVISTGSDASIPGIPGLAEAEPW